MRIRRFEQVPGFVGEIPLPARQTAGSAGYDLRAAEDAAIAPGEVRLVATGVRAVFPPGEFLAIFARSSLAVRRKLGLANGVGVIDSDYCGNPDNGGHLFVPLWNFGSSMAYVQRGERIAQGIFLPFLLTVDDRPAAERREGGFGSTDGP